MRSAGFWPTERRANHVCPPIAHPGDVFQPTVVGRDLQFFERLDTQVVANPIGPHRAQARHALENRFRSGGRSQPVQQRHPAGDDRGAHHLSEAISHLEGVTNPGHISFAEDLLNRLRQMNQVLRRFAIGTNPKAVSAPPVEEVRCFEEFPGDLVVHAFDQCNRMAN